MYGTGLWQRDTIKWYDALMAALIEDLDSTVPPERAGFRPFSDLTGVTSISEQHAENWLHAAQQARAVELDGKLLRLTQVGMLGGANSRMTNGFPQTEDNELKVKGFTRVKAVMVGERPPDLTDEQVNAKLHERGLAATDVAGVLNTLGLHWKHMVTLPGGRYMIEAPEDENERAWMITRMAEAALMTNPDIQQEEHIGAAIEFIYAPSYMTWVFHERQRIAEAGWNLARLINSNLLLETLPPEAQAVVRLLLATYQANANAHSSVGEEDDETLAKALISYEDAFDYDMDNGIAESDAGWRMAMNKLVFGVPVEQFMSEGGWLDQRAAPKLEDTVEYRISDEGLEMSLLLRGRET